MRGKVPAAPASLGSGQYTSTVRGACDRVAPALGPSLTLAPTTLTPEAAA